MPRNLYFETFGCQMNVLDSQLVLGQLRAQGYRSVDHRDSADVVIYNTCSVREHAEQKVWSRLGELRAIKKNRPDLVIAVIGCMAEREGADLFRKYPHIDILCGPAELDKLPTMLHNAVVTTQGFGVQGSGFRNASPSPSQGEGRGEGENANHTDPRHTSVDSVLNAEPRTLNPKHQSALLGSSTRRTSTLAAAQDTLELLDLSRSISPTDDVSQAYVRITRGCNKFCTYCVVPYTRGPEVHRPPQNIIDEVKKLVDAGSKEVTLLGQTVNHYHYVHGDGRETSFADLLYLVHESIPDLPRLRFVTSFPRDFTDEALQAMRDCDRICRYLHVPAQSGSDRILKLMNRGYTARQYRDFIDRARDLMPDISIASDFIVGFPTETEQDHQTTLDLIRHCRFKNSFIFKYSPRPGTIAIDRFEDDIPEETKRRRNNEVLAVQQQVSTANNRAMVGKTVEVIVEGESKLVSRQSKSASSLTSLTIRGASQDAELDASPTTTQLVARTRGDQVVVFDGDPSLKGQLLDVEIIRAESLTLFARPLLEPATVFRA